MQIKLSNGQPGEITMEEAERVHRELEKMNGDKKGSYQKNTETLMHNAQKEIREATGDYPENMSELYEFAVKHELFGDREDTHVMCNFLKLLYAMLQEETHS